MYDLQNVDESGIAAPFTQFHMHQTKEGARGSQDEFGHDQQDFMTKLNNSVKNGFFVPTADLDDVERLKNANMMVENIVFTLANISADQQQHQELIHNGLIEVLQKVVKLFTDCRRERNAQGINEFEEGMVVLKVMPTGALKMIKSVSDIINNLTQNTAI